MIAPTFESLATKYAKPNKIAFAKVDVDAQADVAQQYSVRAMPTFLVLRNGSVIDTIQGANPPALIAAVEKAVKLAGVGGAGGGAVFKTTGQRLGGSGVVGEGARGNAGRSVGRSRMAWNLRKILDGVIAFLGLYLVSLFSVSCPLFPVGCWVVANVSRSLTPTSRPSIQCSTRRILRRVYSRGRGPNRQRVLRSRRLPI